MNRIRLLEDNFNHRFILFCKKMCYTVIPAHSFLFVLQLQRRKERV